jgi:hexulose-6-phosphate isomerase
MSLNYKFGVMQGRLSPMVENRIQIFPKKNWRKEFPQAKKLGLKHIEWTLDYDTFNQNPILNKSGISEIKKLSKKYSIKIMSLTGDCFMQRPFWKISKNQKLIKDFKRVLNSCNKIGVKYVVVPLVDNGKLENLKTEKKLIKILNSLQDYLKKKKIQILFESDLNPKKFKKFISNFDQNLFGINYDLGNSASLGYDIDEEFRNYFEHIKNIHIKDRMYNGNTVRLGEGNANFNKFFKNLKKYKYDNMLIYQTARSNNNNDIYEIKKNMLFIKKQIKQNV